MTTKERTFADLAKLPCVLLKTLGYDFLDQPRPRWLRVLLTLYFVLCLMCCSYFTYFALDFAVAELAVGAKDLPLLLRLIDDIVYNVVGILKSYFFIRNSRSIKKLYKKFGDIFPISMEDRLAYRVDEYYWPKWITTILYMQLCALTIILFVPFAESIFEYVGALISLGYGNAKFGYYRMYEETSYGFGHHNFLGYVVSYSLDVMNALYSAIWMICTDIWLVAFALQLCMHFDYISRTLENYEPHMERSQDDQKVLAGLVRKHQTILE